jgi:hypothetical protein
MSQCAILSHLVELADWQNTDPWEFSQDLLRVSDYMGLKEKMHRLNTELDLQSLFGLLCTAVLRPRNSPPPPHLGSHTRALLVS